MVSVGYKQTEVGDLPEGWGLLKIGDAYEFKNGLNKEKSAFGHGTPIVNYMDVFEHPGLSASDIQGLVSVTKEEKSAYSARQGDVFFTRTSETVDDIGLTSVLEDDVPDAVFSGFVLRGRSKGDRNPLTTNFQRYCFRSEIVRSQIRSSASYTTRALTNGKLLSKVNVPFPREHSEQKNIAEALSDVDRLIAGLEALIAKKRALKTATMQQVLTGKTRLPGFVGDWKEISIGKDARLAARIGWQALTTKEYMESGDYLLITGTDFLGGAVDWSSCWFVDEWRYSQDRKIQIREQDVLVTKDGTIGKAGYVEELVGPATLNSGVFVIRPIDNSFCPKFLYHVLTSRVFDEFIDEISAGSTITHLYQKDFVKFSFMAPEYNEQEEISEVLSSMDQDISALEVRLSKTKALKQGVMQELLTGRTRLV